MLLELDIRNFALVEHANLEFTDAFTVMTGETGAGKSILLDALGLALGERTSPEVVRHGATAARVQARFDVSTIPESVERLASHLGVTLDDGELIVDRELTATGKNTARANGVLLTVSNLKQLTSALVVNSGQHDQQRLLEPARQMQWFDNSSPELRTARLQVQLAYAKWQSCEAALQSVVNGARDRAREVDLLAYQVQEIEEASLTLGEDVTLEEQLQLASNADKRRTLAESINVELSKSQLYTSLRDAERLAGLDITLAYLPESINGVVATIEDLASELSRYSSSIDVDELQVVALDNRRQVIRDLLRKYGPTIDDVLAFRDASAARLAELSSITESQGELEHAVESAWVEYSTAANALTGARIASRPAFCSRIEGYLHRLAMPHASFDLLITDCDASPSGNETIQFLFAPNPGQPAKLLGRIASGGEMSRVLLALTAELASVDDTPVYVFDEIDAGIGGKTAHSVAATLCDLSRHGQVLCISHLPVVAASASQQFVIEKSVTDGKTSVTITDVRGETRVREMARMLSGQTDAISIESARNLLGVK
jgi:DNA repair protein RecN (Recombination protein N)